MHRQVRNFRPTPAKIRVRRTDPAERIRQISIGFVAAMLAIYGFAFLLQIAGVPLI